MARFQIELGAKKLATDAPAIDIGTRSTCFVALDDPVASEEHAQIEWRAGEFVLKDSGSASGTWCNGAPVQGTRVLQDGDVLVLGCTRMRVALGGSGEARTLSLTVEEQAFFFEPSRRRKDAEGRYVVGGDAERWVREEVSFSRFRPLGLLNKLAAAAAVLALSVLAIAGLRARFLQPGEVVHAHAAAAAQGCAACHGALGGAPAQKCGQCHADLMDDHHPFPSANLGIKLDDDLCASCHLDHQGATPLAGSFVFSAERTATTCAGCHGATLPPAPALGTQRAAQVEVALTYDNFPHRAHAELKCDTCHARGAAGGRDFGRVGFESCMRCHSADETRGERAPWPRDPALAALAQKVKPEHRVHVEWHGSGTSDADSRCLDCHAARFEKGLRQVESAVREPLAFRVPRWGHGELFESHVQVADARGEKLECTRCHADAQPLLAGTEHTAPFFHGVHVTSILPNTPELIRTLSLECRACHAEQLEAQHLATAYAGARPAASEAGCGACHRSASGPLHDLVAALAQPKEKKPRTDFPHAAHMHLEQDCFTCHAFWPEDSFGAQPATLARALTCVPCHEQHQNVGGNGCQLCHASREAGADPVYAQRTTSAQRPDNRGFSHWSAGHSPSMERGQCSECHAGIERAESLAAVAFPSEFEPSCWKCHVEERQRFHWRRPPVAEAR